MGNNQSQDSKYFYDESTAKKLEEHLQQSEIQANDQINVENQLDRITLNLIPRHNLINVKYQEHQIPVIMQLKVAKSQKQNYKAGIDLSCVVDVSGSMEGENLQLVMNSLRYIQKILSYNDRISIVTFATVAKINLPWTRNTSDNKEKIKQAIMNMQIRDNTNIADGVKLGLRMIKNRKYKNPVTCMFVLTDGQDNKVGADDRVANALKKYDIKDQFVINSFGYGYRHDAKTMNNIANLKGGTFTFIENIQKSSEHFILAISGMLSVVAKNTQLTIQVNSSLKIHKIFGDNFLWKQNEKGNYQMDINYLQDGESKEFVVLVEQSSIKQANQLEQAIVLKASLQGMFTESNKEFMRETQLQFYFTLEEVQYEAKEVVEVNFLRAKSGDIIGEAKDLAKQQKYDQAQQLLNKMMIEIEESQFKDSKQLVIVLKDLEQIKTICKPQLFEQKGEAFMLNKLKNHIQRQHSLNNSMEWNSDQEEQMENFKQGKLQLSCCSGEDDYQNNAQLDSPVQQFQQEQKRSNQSIHSDCSQ